VEERRGGGFCNHLAAAKEATKKIKIKIRRGLNWLQNVVKNVTINKKRAASMERRWDGTRAGWRVLGERNSVVLRVIELGGGGGDEGKIDQ
jgi:hypothetical protein